MWELAKKPSAAGAILLLGLLAGAFSGCGSTDSSSSVSASPPGQPKVESARATLHPMAGSKASGSVVLTRDPQGYALSLDAQNLEPTRGAHQYALWQLQDPEDLVSLRAAEDMVMLATYRVGGDRRLTEEFEPPLRAYEGVPEGRLTHFLITLIDSPERLQDSIVEFDETGKPPDLGRPVAEGTFSGRLVGAAARR